MLQNAKLWSFDNMYWIQTIFANLDGSQVYRGEKINKFQIPMNPKSKKFLNDDSEFRFKFESFLYFRLKNQSYFREGIDLCFCQYCEILQYSFFKIRENLITHKFKVKFTVVSTGLSNIEKQSQISSLWEAWWRHY